MGSADPEAHFVPPYFWFGSPELCYPNRKILQNIY